MKKDKGKGVRKKIKVLGCAALAVLFLVASCVSSPRASEGGGKSDGGGSDVVSTENSSSSSSYIEPGPYTDPLEKSAVFYLPFEGKGFTERDASGHSGAAELSGVLKNPKYQARPVEPYRPQGVRGKALSFDGYSQSLEYDGSVGGRSLTIEAYVCPRAFCWSAPQSEQATHIPQTIVSSFDSGANKGFQLGITKFGYLTFRVGTGSEWIILTGGAEYKLSTYEWNRVTAVFDGNAGYMALYLDGKEAANRSINRGSEIMSSGRKVMVGASSEPIREGMYEISKFNGLMDELKIYSKAKTEAQIAEYGEGMTGGVRPPISYDAARLPDSALSGDYYRPQYHAAPPGNWMNEPHTLFTYNGKWHLFYQYNPVGPYWRNICWGHWVSDDMVDWKHVKEAVVPTENTVTPDGVWTGNVVYDDKNRPQLLITAGDDMRPYNGSNQHVGLVKAKDYADPDLTEWEIVGFAVKQNSQMGVSGEFRDAQAFGIGNERYMVVGGSVDGRGTAHVFKTTADKLQDWTYMGELFVPQNYKGEYGRVWEMPNLVPLPRADGTPSGKYLFVFSPQHGDNDVWYYIGNFDRTSCRFTADFADAKLMDFGNNVFTGPTVYLNPDNNKVYICSIMQDQRSDADHYDAGWAHTAGLPRELFLHTDGGLGIKNVDTSSVEGKTLAEFNSLTAGEANAALANVNTDMAKIEFSVSGNTSRCGFRLKKSGGEYVEIYFTPSRLGVDTSRLSQMIRGDFSGELNCSGTVNGVIYLDKALVEAYVNERATLSASCYCRGGGIEAFGDGGARFTVKIKQMRSIRKA